MLRANFQLQHSNFHLNVALELPGQGIIALFGPSGSGKTSLLRCFAGLTRSLTGKLEVNGTCWQDESQKIFRKPHQRAVGYVFQEASLFPHLNVMGNLKYGWKRVPPSARQLHLEQVINWLGIEHLLERTTTHLSGGERQRVAIARALLTSPQLLLMDEPLASLDEIGKHEILPYLEKLHHHLSIPVIYVSHDLAEVSRIADYLVLLESGRVQASGPFTEMVTRLDLPLARDHHAGAVLDAEILGHEDAYHLMQVKFSGGLLYVPTATPPPTDRTAPAMTSISLEGHKVRLRIPAIDVSITLERSANTSILNIFAGTVVEIAETSLAQRIVKVDVNGTLLLAQITHKSCERLQLQPGKTVFVQVKSIVLVR